VHIFPVKPNHGPHQYFCSPQGPGPVKIRRIPLRSVIRFAGSAHVLSTILVLMTLAFAGASAMAQEPVPTTQNQPSNTIDEIRVIGNRRIPKETILARLFTHPGDTYDPISIERDFNSLWNTGYFDDLRIDREDTEKGVILNIFVREKPDIREINYKGLNSVTQSDVLDRFKKEKVPLSVDSQYDPTKIKLAETVLKELLAEHGHQFATIHTVIKTIPPASVSVNFNVKEGPTVKVGHIKFEGNNDVSGRTLRASMKNLKPIGIPHSIIL
jgi:outer membrane protein insertion porin family